MQSVQVVMLLGSQLEHWEEHFRQKAAPFDWATVKPEEQSEQEVVVVQVIQFERQG